MMYINSATVGYFNVCLLNTTAVTTCILCMSNEHLNIICAQAQLFDVNQVVWIVFVHHWQNVYYYDVIQSCGNLTTKS